MSQTTTTPSPLSETDIAFIAAEISAGRPPMVWFTAAAVGVPAGRSGKVMALGDRTGDDFLSIKPTGSKDVLSFSPAEVTMSKPAKPKKSPEPPASHTENELAAQGPGTATRKDTRVSSATVESTTTPAASESVANPTSSKSKSAAARKSKAPDVVVTLTGTADGVWTVEATSGKKRAVKALSVTSVAAAQAAQILHPDIAEVVDGVLAAARGAQRAKVEQLQAELQQAQALLAELSDEPEDTALLRNPDDTALPNANDSDDAILLGGPGGGTADHADG